MDVDLARTFLAVVESGSFARAAEQVHVTQSTVSTRIKILEERLGRRLFDRSKAGAALTPAGVQFHRHALGFVRLWEQAKLQIAIRESYDDALSIGAQPSLWDGYLMRWLPWMRRRAPAVALRAQILAEAGVLMQRLADGALDLGVLYRPVQRPGFVIRRLFDEQLVMVTSEPDPPKTPGERYVFVDWGPEFQSDHALAFPDMALPSLYLNLGTLGVNFLLENSATAYFPIRSVQPFLARGELRRIESAPVFSYPTYVVYAEHREDETLATALEGLAEVAQGEATARPSAGDAPLG